MSANGCPYNNSMRATVSGSVAQFVRYRYVDYGESRTEAPDQAHRYTPTDVQLTLTSGIGQIGLTLNQSSVAAALDNSFNTGGGTLPGLLGLSAAQLPAAMDALSGRVGRGSFQGAHLTPVSMK